MNAKLCDYIFTKRNVLSVLVSVQSGDMKKEGLALPFISNESAS